MLYQFARVYMFYLYAFIMRYLASSSLNLMDYEGEVPIAASCLLSWLTAKQLIISKNCYSFLIWTICGWFLSFGATVVRLSLRNYHKTIKPSVLGRKWNLINSSVFLFFFINQNYCHCCICDPPWDNTSLNHVQIQNTGGTKTVKGSN